MQADWELSKENFQPLKRGRKEVCKENRELCQKADVGSQRKHFWQELRAYNGDDPLDVWIRFIKWTQDTFKTGGHQAELLPLLERCTRELQDRPQYKSDIRYLRVWIQYADCLPEPRDVFRFLKENNIGQDFALYYLAYAAYMELRGNFAKADAIFQDGLARLAHPIDRLRTKCDDFQHRMAKRLDRKEQATSVPDACQEPVRSSLAVLSVHNKPRAQQSSAAGAFALARPKRKATGNPGKENNGGLEIFVDDEFKPGNPEPGPLPAAPVTGLWTKLGGFEQNRKENVQKASKWSDQRLAQKPSLVQPAIPVLDIPVDEGIQDRQSPYTVNPVPKSISGQGMPVEALTCLPGNDLHPPVALWDAAPAEACDSAASAVGPARRPLSLQSKKHEVAAYTAVHLADSPGQEVSFEEVRAAKWLARQTNIMPRAPLTDDPVAGSQLHDIKGETSSEPSVLPLASMNAAPSVPSTSADRLTLLSPHNAAPSVASAEPLPIYLVSPPSTAAAPVQPDNTLLGPNCCKDTVNTHKPKVAAHKAPLHRAGDSSMLTSSAVQQVAVSSPKQVAASSPTLNTLRLFDMTSNVTMATKDAFACVNAMFSSSLCHEPSHPSKPVVMAEPTVTISTQAAFAELNQMFSSDLPHHKQRAGPEQQQMLQRPAPRRAVGKRLAPHAAVAPQIDLGTGASGGPKKLATHKGSGFVQADVAGLGLYEDTCFLDSPKPAAGADDAAADNETHGLAVYEDTNFFGGQPAVEGNPCNAEHPSSSHPGMQHTSGNDTVGFQMYEDTQCLAQRPGLSVDSADDDMGFGIYEDTQFTNQAKQEQKAASVSLLPDGSGIQEDTLFVGGAKADFARQDTQADQPCSPAGFGIYEDTQFFDKENCDGARLMSQAAAANDLEQADDKENQHGPVKSFARDISDSAADAAALQPLTGRRAAQLGLTQLATDGLHANMPLPKNKLAEVASSTVGDQFDIFQDEKQHAVPTPKQRLATQVQGLDAAMQHMSPFRQRPQSIQTLHAMAAVDQHVIDPFNASLHSSLLAGLEPPLEQWEDVLPVDANPSEFDKLKQVRRQNVKPISLQLGSHTMMVQQKLGQGAFASVYQVAQVGSKTSSPPASGLHAMKVQSPPCPWEFYICKVLQGRVAPVSRSLFLSADMLYLLPKHSVMLTPYGRRGTLQDMLNAYLRKGKRMEEVLVMFYATELLHITATLQAAHIIHTDIKPDNLLLRETASSALPAWHPSRPGLWSKTGLCLIDYGRAVDTALLPSNTKFKGDSQTEAFRCIEMQEGRAWGWGVDAFGVCSTIHCLLFGEYMQVEKTISPEGAVGYRLKTQLKRYWATDLWQTLFDALLQPSDSSDPPPYDRLLALFQQHLSKNPATASKLRAELVKQDST